MRHPSCLQYIRGSCQYLGRLLPVLDEQICQCFISKWLLGRAGTPGTQAAPGGRGRAGQIPSPLALVCKHPWPWLVKATRDASELQHMWTPQRWREPTSCSAQHDPAGFKHPAGRLWPAPPPRPIPIYKFLYKRDFFFHRKCGHEYIRACLLVHPCF